MNLFDGTITNLKQSIDYAAAKNRTISANIANVDTPNYKSKDVAFKNVLNDEMNYIEAKHTNSLHLPFGKSNQGNYKVVTNNRTVYNHNGNNVDIDKEMTDLAKNQIYYNGLIDRINGKFNSLQTVIRGGN